jgi:two-component system sensor histidine kinase PilS (NtrC family)
MHDPIQEEKINITSRLRWLMLSRVAIATFLLGITVFINIRKTELLPDISFTSLYFLILLTYILSIIYVFLPKFIRNLKVHIYIQTLCDVVLITGLVFVTGGIRSIYSVFYPLVIIYSVLFLARGGGLIIASACSIFYGLLLDLEYYRIIHPLNDMAIDGYPFSAGYVFTRIFIHILSFYIIAFLASFVVEKEKMARTLLAEKETAFDQLDLLHRSIIESVDTGIMTINLQGKIKSFNRGAEEITGFSFGKIENRFISEIFPDYSEIFEQIEKDAYKKSARSRFDMLFPGKKNKIFILGCSVSTLKDNKGKRIGDIIIFQDVTGIREMENALEKNRRLAFTGEMAAALAHEMRNPLASISGSIQVLKKDLRLNAADEKLMQIIMRGREQLESFIKDFLLLARPTPGRHETIFIREIIEDVIESIQYVPDWNDQIKMRLSLTNNLRLNANKTEMREIVWNLVLNAIQAMHEGGVLDIEADTQQYDNGKREFVEIRVRDTGSGIEEKHFEKIFEPFFTTKERGTGLGLAIVNRIVESYAGRIQVESIPEKGTAFIVTLPVNINGR